jgi:hypothetical protein
LVGVGEELGLGEEVEEVRGGDGLAGVGGELGEMDGGAVDGEDAVTDGAADGGVGREIENGRGEGEEFGGDIAAEGGVGFLVERSVGGPGLDEGVGGEGVGVAGVCVDDKDAVCGSDGVGREGDGGGEAEGGEEGAAFEGAGGIVGKDEAGGGWGHGVDCSMMG